MIFPETIIALDIETTDSNNEKGSIIEIGAIAVNPQWEIVDGFQTYIKPLDNYHNPEARRVHGLTDEFLQSDGIDAEQAFNEFEDFCKYHAGDRPLLASWGNYFDINFIRAQYKRMNRKCPFSYRSIDLKSIALWEMAKRDIPMNYERGHGVEAFLKELGMQFDGKPHNAYDDILNTLHILSKLR